MKEKKLNYISLLNVVSCVAVVYLHTNGCFWSFSNERYWKTANIIECLFYFAVPCFFMISGSTLLDYRDRYSTKEYFKKRIQKTVIPFFVWSFVGLLYNICILKNINIQELTVKSVWNGIVNTSFVTTYWFFPTLFSIYLSIPLFAAVEKCFRKEVFSYLAVVGFIINFLIPLLKNSILNGVSWPISVGVVSGNMIYIVLGYLLDRYELTSRQRMKIYMCSIVGYMIHLIGTYIVSFQAGEVLRTYKGYASAHCIMYSIGVFVWFKYNGEKLLSNKIVNKVVRIILPYTFGIYLVQSYIYKTMIKYMDIDTKSIVYRLGAPIVIIPIAICTLRFIKKIPIVKHIAP